MVDVLDFNIASMASGTQENMALRPQAAEMVPVEQGGMSTWNFNNLTFGINPGQAGFDLSSEADGIYSSFYDPSFPLTGVDYADWMEVEKIFSIRNG